MVVVAQQVEVRQLGDFDPGPVGAVIELESHRPITSLNGATGVGEQLGDHLRDGRFATEVHDVDDRFTVGEDQLHDRLAQQAAQFSDRYREPTDLTHLAVGDTPAQQRCEIDPDQREAGQRRPPGPPCRTRRARRFRTVLGRFANLVGPGAAGAGQVDQRVERVVVPRLPTCRVTVGPELPVDLTLDQRLQFLQHVDRAGGVEVAGTVPEPEPQTPVLPHPLLALTFLVLGSNLGLATLRLLTGPLQRFTLRQVQQVVFRSRVRCRRVSHRTRRLGREPAGADRVRGCFQVVEVPGRFEVGTRPPGRGALLGCEPVRSGRVPLAFPLPCLGGTRRHQHPPRLGHPLHVRERGQHLRGERQRNVLRFQPRHQPAQGRPHGDDVGRKLTLRPSAGVRTGVRDHATSQARTPDSELSHASAHAAEPVGGGRVAAALS